MEEEEEQPVTEPNSEEEREDDAPCQGKDRYRGLDPPRPPLKAQGSFLTNSLQPHLSGLLPSSLAPTGTPLRTLYTWPRMINLWKSLSMFSFENLIFYSKAAFLTMPYGKLTQWVFFAQFPLH